MLIILGRPFLNTAEAVIDCNKGNVTFHVNGNEHTVHFYHLPTRGRARIKLGDA